MKKTWIRNGKFLTDVEKATIISGHLVIEGDRITYVGETSPPVDTYYDEIIDGTHKLYMPGLVNTHGHAAMSLLRGVGDDLALRVWLEQKMWPLEAKFTAHDVKWGTLLAIVEMIKGGTTAFVDMYDHMDQVAQAVEQSGARGCLTRGVIGLCDRVTQDAKWREAVEFAKTWHKQASGRITTMLAPHALYTCPPDYIERFIQASHDIDVPMHIHVSESLDEVNTHIKQYHRRPVEHLHQLGMFTRPTLLAHAVHLTDEEIDLIANHHVHISHNPGSNLKLASGIARVPDLLARGVRVSLGTDGPASNNNLDLFEEMRLAALLHKGVTLDPTVVPATQALAMGTIEGAKSIWLEDVGQIQVGDKADFIALDIDQPHFFPYSQFVSHVVYVASARDVTDVCVDGQWLVRNRNCLTLDEEKIKHEAKLCYEGLIA